MIEHEYKYLLDSSLYYDTLNKLTLDSEGKKIIQINYYYDTSDFELNRKNITFRIRQKEEKLHIEIKYPVEEVGLLHVKNEVTFPILKLPNTIDIRNFDLDGYLGNQKNIMLIGSLLTERTSFYVENGIRIDVDKNYYLGFIDYELEIEFEKNMSQEAMNILRELTCNTNIASQCGKRDRFMSKLREMKALSYPNN